MWGLDGERRGGGECCEGALDVNVWQSVCVCVRVCACLCVVVGVNRGVAPNKAGTTWVLLWRLDPWLPLMATLSMPLMEA